MRVVTFFPVLIISVKKSGWVGTSRVTNVPRPEGCRGCVSGLKENYKKEELINKRVIVIRNLKHAVIRGIESQGMLLAAVFKDKVSLAQPDKDIEIGAKVM